MRTVSQTTVCRYSASTVDTRLNKKKRRKKKRKNAEVFVRFVELCGECVPFGFVVVPPYNCKRVTTLLLEDGTGSGTRIGTAIGSGAGQEPKAAVDPNKHQSLSG